MKASLIRIGNSRGVRIPKSWLQQCALNDEVEIEMRGNAVVIRPLQKPRHGWEEAFARMAAEGDDVLLAP